MPSTNPSRLHPVRCAPALRVPLPPYKARRRALERAAALRRMAACAAEWRAMLASPPRPASTATTTAR